MMRNVHSTSRFYKIFPLLSIFFITFVTVLQAYSVTVNVRDINNNPLQAVNMNMVRISDEQSYYNLYTNSSGVVQLGLQYPNVTNFPPGTYTVRNTVVPAANGKIYFPTYYGNAFSASSATSFTVSSGQTTDVGTIQLNIYEQVTINGQVRNASGVGLSGVKVAAFVKYSGFKWVKDVYTDGSGNYALPVPAGLNLMLKTEVPGYFDTFYSGTAAQAYGEDTAATVNLSVSVNGYVITMNTVSTINGTVRNSSGTGLGGAEVFAFEKSGDFKYLNKVTTAGDGTYTLTVPSNVNLMLRTSLPTYTTVYYDQEFFDWSKSVTINLSSATTTNKNFTLYTARTISGTVTANPSGTALATIEIDIFTSQNVYITNALTNGSGQYTIANIPDNADYFLQATANGYFAQWYNRAYGYGDRTTVNVSGSNRTGINFSLYSNGTISGTMQDSAGANLSGVRVTAYVKGTNYTYITNTTANAGNYSLTIPVGAQIVLQATTANQFLGYPSGSWYNGKDSSANATTFTGTSTNINFVLDKRWIVSGNVQPAGTLVEIFDWKNWNGWRGQATANASGYYTISGTGNVNFPVMIRYSTGNYVTELYNDKNNYNNLVTANDQVTVNIGTTTNISAQSLALGGTISGTISGAGTGVITINIEDTNGVYFTEVTTNGSYSVSRIPSGNWKLKAMRSGAVTEYYGGVTTTQGATAITLSAGGTSSNINIVLDAALSISGRVSNNSGTAIQNSRVVLFTTGNLYVQETLSAANGTYTFNNVIPGGYFVQATANSYFDQWYSNGYGYADRTTINLTTLPTSNVNFALYAIGTISGRVSDSAGVGLSGVRVTAYVKGSNYTYITNTTSNAGYYSISIPVGATFNLQATTTNSFLGEPQGTGLYGVWHNGQTSSANATTFTGSSTNINFVLDKRWVVSGNVQPAGTLVELFDWKNWNQYYGSATSNASGFYTISGTGNANFPVMIRYSTGNYVTELYNDKNNYNNLVTANDQVTVNIGTTTNISAQSLALGGTIAGTISAAGGSGIITVNIEDANGVYFTSVTTNGAYSVSRIPSGNWKVRAMRSGCVSEYYGERAGTLNATTINLTAGGTSNNININIGPEWTISGTVRKNDGSPLSGATVQAYFYNNNWEFVSQAITAVDGSYTIRDGYNTTQVFVKVGAAGYVDAFYNGKTAGYPTADAISVVVSGSVTGINITMNGSATITGVVRDDTGALLVSADVKVFDKNGSFTYRAGAVTSTTGSYTVIVPDATPLMVKFEKSGYEDVFYNATNNWQGAVTFNIANGGVSSNINATLNRQWRITGNVILGDGQSVSGAAVEVFGWKNWSQYLGGTIVTGSGYYEITGTGNISAMVRYSKPGYVSILYPSQNNYNNLVTADSRIVLTAPANFSCGVTTLNRAGAIAGTITAQGGSGVITVNIEDANGNYFTSITTNGSYSVTGIPSGNWKVKALRDGCVAEYYGETASTGNATTVNVVPGTTVNNVNITIAPAWTISGNIIVLGGGAAAGVLVEVYEYRAGWHYIDSTTTNVSGNYIISQGYNTQNVFIRATSTNYVPLFYNNKTGDWSNANSLAMYPGLTTTNINFVIYRTGTITGRVSDNAGLGLSGVTVTAFLASDHSWVAETTTTVTGGYTLSVLPATGLLLVASRNAYLPQMYNGNNDVASWSGTTVSVTGGGTSTNINFALTPYWSVGGRVRLSDGAAVPLSTVVYLYDVLDLLTPVATASVNGAGLFRFTATSNVSINALLAVSLNSYSEATKNIRIKSGDETTLTANVDLYLLADITPVPAGKSVKDTIMSGPNPANPDKEPIHIGMILEVDSRVSVRVYTLGGEKVYENTKHFAPGYNAFVWNGEDLFSDKIPNGVYLAYIEVDTGNEKIKKSSENSGA